MIINTLSEDEKRKCIEENIFENIFVEAGAGAGKTTLIVRRIVNQIRQGMKPEKLVVITFTNKAAGELFERIEAAFEKEEKNSTNPEEKKAFQYALENIEKMTISTIHSFCFKLLRERCFDAMLPLDVTLLENDEAVKRQKKFILKWMANLEKSQIEEIKEAVFYCSGKEYYKTEFENIFLSICEKPEDVQVFCPDEKELLPIKQEVEQLLLKKEAVWKDIINDMQEFVTEFCDYVERRTGESVDNEFLKKHIYAQYNSLIWFDENKLRNDIGKKGDLLKLIYAEDELKVYKGKDLCDEMTEWCAVWVKSHLLNIKPNNYEQYAKLQETIVKKAKTYAYYVLTKYALSASLDYKKTLDGHTLSNDELLQRTKTLVCSSKEAVQYFARKYDCIYVDEFQDTDHIQADLIWEIACGGTNELRDGALFIVGDPKQAIYRFRGGEPEVYYDIKKRMCDMSEAVVYELDNNYRSNEEIISWVNDQFKGPLTGDKIVYRDMVCKAKELPEETKDPVLQPIKGVYRLEKGIEKKEDEANVLAEFIFKLVQGNYGIYETERKADDTRVRRLRKIKYSDFLLLCRDKNDMKDYLEKLEGLGIPVEIAGETKVQNNMVLNGFVKLFCYLQSPYDEKAKKGAGHIVAPGEVLEAEQEEKIRLKELRENTKGMNAYALAMYLLNHMEYVLPLGVILTKIQMVSVQAKLRQMVESVFESAKGNPIELSETFKKYLETGIERELPLFYNRDAVQFMNLHKAKGLEGAITILMNRKEDKQYVSSYKTSKKNAEGKYDYYGTAKLGDPFFVIGVDGYDFNRETEKIKILSEAEETAEKIRLDYVAATRAKEVLVVMKELKEPAVFSKYAVPESNSLDFVLNTEFENSMENEEEQVSDYVFQNDTISDEMYEKTYIKISPSDLEGSVEDEEEETVPDKNYVVERRPRGNVFGTTMHRSFELLVQNFKEESLSIEECVCRAVIENIEDLVEEGKKRYIRDKEDPEEYPNIVKEYLVKALTDFYEDKDIRELLLSAKEIYTELPFSYYTSKEEDKELFESLDKHLKKHKIEIGSNQPVWINGTADLVLLFENGDIWIIDYKSDTKKVASLDVFEDTLQKKYEGQLTLYQHSMSRIFGVQKDRIETRLYHLY